MQQKTTARLHRRLSIGEANYRLCHICHIIHPNDLCYSNLLFFTEYDYGIFLEASSLDILPVVPLRGCENFSYYSSGFKRHMNLHVHRSLNDAV